MKHYMYINNAFDEMIDDITYIKNTTFIECLKK